MITYRVGMRPSLATLLSVVGLLLVAVAPIPGASATEPVAPLMCDPTGDGGWNDCVRHRHVHGTRDHVLNADESLTLRSRIHPALHGANLIGETQVRPLDLSGNPTGAWTTVSTYQWNADPAGAKHAKATQACSPPRPGLYQVRTRVEIPKSHHGAVQSNGPRTGGVYATSSATTVASNGGNCYDSESDENIIEYFNLINYMGDFMLKVTSKSDDEYDVSIICPQRESTDMPPSEFALTLATPSGDLKTECYSPSPLTISKTNADCESDGQCRFIITASNSSTQKIYSQTEIMLVLTNDLMENPELSPASLPICLSANAVTACLGDDSCSLDTSQQPTLEISNPGDDFDAEDPVSFSTSSGT